MSKNFPSTSAGKKVSFSRQQHNFVLDLQRNEMYWLDRYLVGLDRYCFDLEKMKFLDMIKMNMQNLLKLNIPKGDCELLLYSFGYLRMLTELLDDLKKHIRKGINLDKYVDELHNIFTFPTSVFVGYNQRQLMETLRLIFDNLVITQYGAQQNRNQIKFYEICKACEENRSFLPEYKHQLRFWGDLVSGKPRHVPTPTVAPEKSILKKPRDH